MVDQFGIPAWRCVEHSKSINQQIVTETKGWASWGRKVLNSSFEGVYHVIIEFCVGFGEQLKMAYFSAL